jgi:hypothetical protein
MPWASEGIAPFLSSEVDGGEWLASSLCCPILREIVHNTHHIAGWMGLRAGLHVMEKTVLSMSGIELRFLSHPACKICLYTGYPI